jgi:glutaredoxin
MGFAAQQDGAAKLCVMELKIVVYSKSACPQCESAKMLLKARSLSFEEIKIDNEAERMAFYEKCGPSVRQMPQVFINDQRVGGLSGLQAALAQLGR